MNGLQYGSVVAITMLVVVCGCKHHAATIPETYGWNETTTRRELVEKAITLSNAVISDQVGLRLAPSWKADSEIAVVPVYLVGLANLTWSDTTFVPQGKKCIVVGGPQLAHFLEDKVDSDENRARVLAVFLLYEVGHLHNGDNGSSVDAAQGILNLDLTEQKRREEAADKFASEQIRDGIRVTANPHRFSSAMSLALVLQSVQFRVTTGALLKDFGGRSPNRFWDRGYTHPNFELRLLVMAHAISPSDASRRLLEEFERDRLSAGKAGVLFRSPDQEHDAGNRANKSDPAPHANLTPTP